MDTVPLPEMLSVLFGSSTGYIADELERLSQPRGANIIAIARTAYRRLGDAVSNPGSIPANLAGALIADGSFCHDPLAQTYWGGILASSRTTPPRDDRGIRLLRLLSRLGVYQIRTHYLFYATLRGLLLERGIDQTDFESRRYLMAVFAPADGYMRAMEFDEPELKIVNTLASDALLGLGDENLLDGSNTGSAEYLKSFYESRTIQGDGIAYQASLLGIRFFLWAFGAGGKDSNHMLVPNFRCAIDGVPDRIAGSAMIYD